jgi:hypothetical protein
MFTASPTAIGDSYWKRKERDDTVAVRGIVMVSTLVVKTGAMVALETTIGVVRIFGDAAKVTATVR